MIATPLQSNSTGVDQTATTPKQGSVRDIGQTEYRI